MSNTILSVSDIFQLFPILSRAQNELWSFTNVKLESGKLIT